MKKLFIIFLLLFSFPIVAENLCDLPFEKILTTIDKQCRNGNKTACNSLVDLYRLGNEQMNIQKNEERQKEYSLLSCKAGDLFSCVGNADYIVQNYRQLCNQQTKNSDLIYCVSKSLYFYRDNKNIKSFLSNLCKSSYGKSSCISLNAPLDNKQEMINYIEEQCQQKSYWACWSRQRYYELTKDKQQTEKYKTLRKQISLDKCDNENEPYHCANVCNYYQEIGDKERQEFYSQKTMNIYRKMCDEKLIDKNLGEFGYSSACKVIADNTESEEERKEYLQKGCNLGDTVSCTDLASIYLNFNGLNQKDDEKSKEYYGKSCDLGDINSCILYKNFHTLLLYKMKRPMKDILRNFYD